MSDADPWCHEHNQPADHERLLQVEFVQRWAKFIGDDGLLETVQLICGECVP